MNIQVMATPDGEPLWTSWSLSGAVHDIKAARVWKIAERIGAAGLIGLGDKGYVGSLTRCSARSRGAASRSEGKTPNPPTPSSAHRASVRACVRSPQLKNWDALRRLRCCPHRTGENARAVPALQLRDVG
ncbi:hypothetical protein [Nocardiopsis dassonvillei]|uniref:hypothetical protein n=1 Tax=Nocardiopsis dassonvillei TaxID=2014 RepID=UPI003F5547A8